MSEELYGTRAIREAKLEAFDNRTPERDYTIQFTIPEFTCLCPISGFPDFATLHIRYVPGPRCVELKSLKLYINGYRDQNVYHEDVVNVVLTDLVTLLDPRYCEVVGDFNVRGNIKTVVRARIARRRGAATSTRGGRRRLRRLHRADALRGGQRRRCAAPAGICRLQYTRFGRIRGILHARSRHAPVQHSSSPHLSTNSMATHTLPAGWSLLATRPREELHQALLTSTCERSFGDVPVDWWDESAEVWRPTSIVRLLGGVWDVGRDVEVLVPEAGGAVADRG